VFRAAAVVESVSLLVLLANLATAHVPVIATLCGPVHGLAYVAVVVIALRDPTALRSAKALAWVPGIGGLLVWQGARHIHVPASDHA
jgi:hypothetical protein